MLRATARERISALLDEPESVDRENGAKQFLELGLWAAHDMYRDWGTFTAAGIQGTMNTLWNNLVRGTDRPTVILADNTAYGIYMQSLQAIQCIGEFRGWRLCALEFVP